MAIIVNTNMSSLIAQRNLTNATNGLNTALQRMSTGYKVNKAADDAAGMFIATNLETQIRGSKVAQTNVKTGTNLLQIAEGDIELLEDNLLRMRDLAVQAANSVYSEESMQAMADEVQYRAQEITRVATASQFNGLHLLDGTGLPDGLRLQVGPNADEDQNSMVIDATVFAATDADTLLGGDAADTITTAFENATNAAAFIETLDTALLDLNTRKAAIGAYQNRLDSALDSLVTNVENSTEAKSTIMDADIAEEAANYSKYQILQQSTAALLTQANQLPALALQLIGG
ncbi:TPA: flagellin FliC [Candidatus Spyradomonas excrementavium]|nr:flagellin FliC [Candidatus Spyradomonas excrementavium]